MGLFDIYKEETIEKIIKNKAKKKCKKSGICCLAYATSGEECPMLKEEKRLRELYNK